MEANINNSLWKNVLKIATAFPGLKIAFLIHFSCYYQYNFIAHYVITAKYAGQKIQGTLSSLCVLNKFNVASMQTEFSRSCSHHMQDSAGLI